jgi:hypothetical protein
MSTLYTRHNYLNKDIEYIISNEIIEYDIQSAGFNIMKKYKLLDEQKIRFLETLGKKQRQIQIGLYQREDRSLVKQLNEKFVEVRKWFFENNDIKDEDILSIKKDAIMTTKRCFVTEFDNITFAEKNIYTSYYYLNNYEFYYNRDSIDVKGIGDDLLELHREYMLDFLFNFFRMNEISKRKSVIDLLKDFAYYYKNKELNIDYYRELNTQSLFKIHERLFGEKIGLKYTKDKDSLDISYNYMNYVVPLISILV